MTDSKNSSAKKVYPFGGPEKTAGSKDKKKEPNPLDKAIELLEEYTEGTPEFQKETDHWGE